MSFPEWGGQGLEVTVNDQTVVADFANVPTSMHPDRNQQIRFGANAVDSEGPLVWVTTGANENPKGGLQVHAIATDTSRFGSAGQWPIGVTQYFPDINVRPVRRIYTGSAIYRQHSSLRSGNNAFK